jgi:two-component system, OmpR family, response regulator VicR
MPRRIAVVNDDTAFLDLMVELLTEEGYEAHPFKETTTAYQGVRDLRPDVIILDVRMENDVAGWQLLEYYKLEPVLTKTPIVVCSADIQALRDRSTHLQTKGCAILAKPFDLNDLLALLDKILGVQH